LGKCEIFKKWDCSQISLKLKCSLLQTPLYLAVLVTEVAIVKILLEYGADATLTNKDSTSVLHCAARKCQFGYEILDLLLTMPEKKLDLSVKDFEGMFILTACIITQSIRHS
jgi:ankyrin repeat protein